MDSHTFLKIFCVNLQYEFRILCLHPIQGLMNARQVLYH
jgi:hypothetical protein